ncbi:hypothetical protein PCE1_004024 [Barthelona sp. PCE]
MITTLRSLLDAHLTRAASSIQTAIDETHRQIDSIRHQKQRDIQELNVYLAKLSRSIEKGSELPIAPSSLTIPKPAPLKPITFSPREDTERLRPLRRKTRTSLRDSMFEDVDDDDTDSEESSEELSDPEEENISISPPKRTNGGISMDFLREQIDEDEDVLSEPEDSRLAEGLVELEVRVNERDDLTAIDNTDWHPKADQRVSFILTTEQQDMLSIIEKKKKKDVERMKREKEKEDLMMEFALYGGDAKKKRELLAKLDALETEGTTVVEEAFEEAIEEAEETEKVEISTEEEDMISKIMEMHLELSDVIDHFSALDLTDELQQATEIKKSHKNSRWLFGSSLNHSLKDTEMLVLSLAQSIFVHNEFNDRILANVYYNLTDDINIPPFPHSNWESIGFQGDDPATDFRGVGIFGLLQLFFFSNCSNAKKCLEISKERIIPFTLVNFNITSLLLNCLRSADLYKLINTQYRSSGNPGIIISVLNDLHLGCWLYLLEKGDQFSFTAFSELKNEIIEHLKSNPERIFNLAQEFEQ